MIRNGGDIDQFLPRVGVDVCACLHVVMFCCLCISGFVLYVHFYFVCLYTSDIDYNKI